MESIEFKYLSEEEIKGLSLFNFIAYCEGVNEQIKAYKVEDGTCKGIDQYLMLKGIEDRYINMALNNVNIDGGVVGFKFDFDVSIEDSDWNHEIKNIMTIRLCRNGGYVIEDSDYNRVPFSFISPLGVVLKELMNKVVMYYQNKESVIFDDID